MQKVMISEYWDHGKKKAIRRYSIHGGTIPPTIFDWMGERYIMPGWYKLEKHEYDIKREDIGYYPFKANKPELPGIDKNKVYKVLSSRGNKHYEVKMNNTGSMECTCPGYGFRRECRHIKEIISSSI